MTFVGVIFFLSGIGIIALFALKRWENTHARVLFPHVRRVADEQALRMKQFLTAGVRDLEKLPPFLLYLLRIGVHIGAVAFGHLAHWIGERSHALADVVSHKHRFERRPPRSEFLMQVNEHSIKNRSNGFVQHTKQTSLESIQALSTPAGSISSLESVEQSTASPSPKKKRRARYKPDAGEKGSANAGEMGLDR